MIIYAVIPVKRRQTGIMKGRNSYYSVLTLLCHSEASIAVPEESQRKHYPDVK